MSHAAEQSRSGSSPTGVGFVAVTLLCYLALGLLVVLTQPDAGPALWYPSLAIGMALLARAGLRWVFAVLVCELIVAIPQYAGIVSVGTIIAVSAAIECLAGALVLRFLLPDRRIANPSDFLKVLLGCGVATPLVLTFFGTAAIRILFPDSPFAQATTGFQWFVGDATGIIVLLPVILLWQRIDAPAEGDAGQTAPEFVLLSIITAALTVWVFVSPATLEAFAFKGQRVVCLLPIIWAAVRFRPRVAALIVLLTDAIALAITWVIFPALAIVSSEDDLLGTQVFMMVCAAGGIGLALAIEGERRAAHASRLASARESAASARLDFLMTSAPAAIYCASAQPPYPTEFMSGGIDRVFGYTPDQFTADSNFWFDRVHPDDRDRVLATVPALIDAGRGIYEYRFRHKDGAYRWVRDELAVVEADNRRVVVGYCIDITAVRHAERVVRESQARFQAFMDNSPVAAWITDSAGRIVYANAGFITLLGVADPTGRALEDVFPRAMAEAFRRNNDAVLKSGAVHELVETAPRSDGTDARYLVYKFPVPIDEGVLAVGGVAIDITDRERFAESLREADRVVRQSEAKFQAFMANSPVAAWITDRDGLMVYASPGYEKMFPIGNPTGKRLEEMYPAAIAAEYRRNNETVLREGRAVEVVESGLRADASPGRFLVCKFPIQADATGNATAVGGVAVDITERERSASALRDAERLANAASIAKSEFLANMSHELRTPLTAILGFADLLAEPDLSEHERLEHVHTIRRNGEHLLAVINDILDLSKIEAGRLTIERLPVRPAQIGAEVIQLLQVRAAAKGIRLDLHADPDAPEFILADPVRLRQILINLVGNAIKFTHAGSVALRIRAAGPHAFFEVRDTGIGMTTEQMARLFRPFEQGDASMSRLYGGTGLGLRISQRLAQMLGGSIAVDSAPDRGSVFTLTLPIGDPRPAAAPQRAPAPPAADLANASVLLVEDGPDNQRLLQHFLTRAGARVTVAANGLLGLAALGLDSGSSAQTPTNFDLIISDMQMPEMDGYEFVRRIRSLGVSTPVLALTANTMSGDERRALDAGCDRFASKPVDR